MSDDDIVEGQTVEFKQGMYWMLEDKNEGICRYISAFANTEGGKIYFGISDLGKKVGIHLPTNKSWDELVLKITDKIRTRIYPISFLTNVKISRSKTVKKDYYIVIVDVPKSLKQTIFYIDKNRVCCKSIRVGSSCIYDADVEFFNNEIQKNYEKMRDMNKCLMEENESLKNKKDELIQYNQSVESEISKIKSELELKDRYLNSMMEYSIPKLHISKPLKISYIGCLISSISGCLPYSHSNTQIKKV